jgi:hypothetical protein
MNFPWSKSTQARDRATAPADASSSSKVTTTMNPSVSQPQLGNGTAASGQQQQRASLLPQERAPVAHGGVREDAGALLLLQQQHQQANLAKQQRASLGQQEQASSVPVQQQRVPVSQVRMDEDAFDNEVSQLTSTMNFEDSFLETRNSRSTFDPVLRTPVASSNNNNTFTTVNVNLIGSRPSSQSGSRPASRSHSRSSSQIGSRPPSRNNSRTSLASVLPSTPRDTPFINTNTDNTDDDDLLNDFSEDAQMNHLFEEEMLDGTIIGETQQGSNPTLDNVAPDFEGVHPDYIMHRLKLIKPDILTHLKLKPFYKSYSSWEKLSTEQKNKTVSFFRKLPEQLRGIVFFFVICCIIFIVVLNMEFLVHFSKCS